MHHNVMIIFIYMRRVSINILAIFYFILHSKFNKKSLEISIEFILKTVPFH